jgi:dienelactone hydrolase
LKNTFIPTDSALLTRLASAVQSGASDYGVETAEEFGSYRRSLISYSGSENDRIPAYLFQPLAAGPHAAVLVHHQHNGERHFGKSEVAGIVGDPLQAFGPALAERGFVVLAPDSICFEDRRKTRQGTTPDPDPETDWLQHFNEMAYRLLRGDLLMRKVISDASRGLSVLASLASVDVKRIGLLGHSYGGNTVLFQAALDRRVAFACASGAACSYAQKIEDGTGIEFSMILPGALNDFDLEQLVTMVAPRRMLLVSASEDKYSKDAQSIAEAARRFRSDSPNFLDHYHYPGGHAMTKARFDDILTWFGQFE